MDVYSMDSISINIRLETTKTKPVPSLGTMVRAFEIYLSYFTFKYEEFKLSRRDCARLFSIIAYRI